MRQRAITGFGFLLLFVLAFSVFFFLNFKTVVVTGPSMEDTFRNGDRLLASRAYWLVGAVRKKDVVVVQADEGKDYIIKRVAYMPGETVDFYNIPDSWSLANGPFVVQPGTYFVLGDNYFISEDSRKFGPIQGKRILGKIVMLPTAWTARAGLLVAVVFALAVISLGLAQLLETRRHRRVDRLSEQDGTPS